MMTRDKFQEVRYILTYGHCVWTVWALSWCSHSFLPNPKIIQQLLRKIWSLCHVVLAAVQTCSCNYVSVFSQQSLSNKYVHSVWAIAYREMGGNALLLQLWLGGFFQSWLRWEVHSKTKVNSVWKFFYHIIERLTWTFSSHSQYLRVPDLYSNLSKGRGFEGLLFQASLWATFYCFAWFSMSICK